MRKSILVLILSLFQITSLQADQVWKLGLPVCLTGACAADGAATLNGARLAVKEINSKGGVLGRKIELLVEDTAEAISGAKAVTAYKKLRQIPDLNYFIGPTWTPGGLALAPIVAATQDVIMVTPSLGATEFHEAGTNIYNSRGVDELGTRRLAKHAWNQGLRTVVILSSQQPWELAQGEFFADEFRRLGGEVLGKFEPLPDSTNVTTESIKTIKLEPDFVFISVVVQLSLYSINLEQLYFKGPKYAAYVDEPRIKAAKGSLEGVITADLIHAKEEFYARYKKAFSVDAMPLPAASAYDTVKLFASVIEKSSSFEPEVIRKALSEVKFSGVTGEFSFDAKGSAYRTPFLKKLIGNTFIDLIPTHS